MSNRTSASPDPNEYDVGDHGHHGLADGSPNGPLTPPNPPNPEVVTPFEESTAAGEATVEHIEVGPKERATRSDPLRGQREVK